MSWLGNAIALDSVGIAERLRLPCVCTAGVIRAGVQRRIIGPATADFTFNEELASALNSTETGEVTEQM